ncbi:MAG: flagellar basal body P-ring formation chaperone FlgA [Candidatus Sumerlaeota bacterium]|nr:flagellar basal body P-ring formation chaperone FlgA [Candidatus Sumerlaeota bacterium]
MTRTRRILFAAIAGIALRCSTQADEPPASQPAAPALALAALDPSLAPVAGVTVSLKTSAKIDADQIALADVADFSGEDYPVIDLLKRVSLGDSPKVGAPLRLTQNQIEKAVAQAAPDARLCFAGAEQTTVERRSMRVQMALLRDELATRLKAQLPYAADRIHVSHIQLPEEIVLPRGQLKLETEFKLPQRLLGQVGFTANFLVDGRPARRLTGILSVDMDCPAYQAIRTIPKGEPIRPEWFREVSWAQSRLPVNAVTALPPAHTDANALKNIQPGEILTEDMIDHPDVVKRNDSVLLVIQKGGLRLSATGLAKQAGCAGEVIKAVNLLSQKEVMARVIDSKTVEVVY